MTENNIIEKINLLGVPLTVFDSYEHAVETIIGRIKEENKTTCIAINPIKIYLAQKDKELLTSLTGSDFQICDGVGASLAAKFLYHKKVHRITGIQLFFELISRAEQIGHKVFLLGAKPESNEGAYNKLVKMHPNLQIVGRHDGYSNNHDNVIQKINNSHADMLFVAKGSPYQEKWINKYCSQINVTFCMGVGGTFDILSKNAKWAPKIFRKTGTEFLYRLIKEPHRLKRQYVLLFYIFLVLKSKFTAGNNQVQDAGYKYEHLK